MGYGPAHGRDRNPGRFMKGSYTAASALDMAKDDLIHDAQLIERSVAAELLCQKTVKITGKFDHGLRRYVVFPINHTLLSVPRISR